MKKFMSLIMSTVLMASMLVGCGSGSAQEPEDAGTTTTTGAEPVTIWYYWEAAVHQEALNKVVNDFNASQSEYVVEAKYVPFADYKKQLSIGASADELPDIAILDNPDLAAYAEMGIFADLTGKFDVSTYYPGPVASCTLDGKLYGVPFCSNDLMLYYNEDMLAAAGKEVPTTWDELLDVAKATTTDNVSGFAHCALQNEEGTFNFLTWLWSTGQTSYEINSEGGLKALNMVKTLVDEGAMPKEAINWTQGDTMNQFISGNLAMMINGTWQVPTIRKEAPDLNWNVAPIPMDKVQTSGLGGENFAVIEGGNEEGALKFLEYTATDEVYLELMDAMGNIASDSVVAEQQYQDDEILQAFVGQMQYAGARGPSPQWPDVSDAISLAFNEVITGASTPEAAAEKAQATIDSVIAQ